MGPQLILEVLDSGSAIAQQVSVQEWFVDSCVTGQQVLQCRSMFLGIERCQVDPIIDQLLVGEPRGATVEGGRDLCRDAHRAHGLSMFVHGDEGLVVVVRVVNIIRVIVVHRFWRKGQPLHAHAWPLSMRDKDSRQLLLAHARLRYRFAAVDSGYDHTNAWLRSSDAQCVLGSWCYKL